MKRRRLMATLPAVQEATNSHGYEMKNHIYEKRTALREATDWTKYEKSETFLRWIKANK